MRRSILLAAHRAYAEPGNGAAITMATLLRWLADAGFEAAAVTSGLIEQAPDLSITRHHDTLNLLRHAAQPRAVVTGWNGPVAITAVETGRNPDGMGEVQFGALAAEIVASRRPTHVLTYGADPCLEPALAAARAAGAQIITTVHACGFIDRAYFHHTDRVITHSAFMAQFFRDQIGLDSTSLPPAMTWSAVVTPDPDPIFLTFINPAAHKGVVPFAALAQRLARERPDIPILVVASGGRTAALAALPDLAKHPALLVCPPRDPREIYGITKLLLVPTLSPEPFGRVAAEAMMNGIPPLVSDRGALPETVGTGGIVLPLPAWLTHTANRMPTDAEMAHWYDTVIRLWDDDAAYARASAAARHAAATLYDEQWQRRRYVDYFTDTGPFPPLFAP